MGLLQWVQEVTYLRFGMMRMSLAFAYTDKMSKESEDQAKFDAVLRRLINSPPISKEEISAKIKAERATKKAAKKSVQKWTIPRPSRS